MREEEEPRSDEIDWLIVDDEVHILRDDFELDGVDNGVCVGGVDGDVDFEEEPFADFGSNCLELGRFVRVENVAVTVGKPFVVDMEDVMRRIGVHVR